MKEEYPTQNTVRRIEEEATMKGFYPHDVDEAVRRAYGVHKLTVDKNILVTIAHEALSNYKNGGAIKIARTNALKNHLRQYKDDGGELFSTYAVALGKLLAERSKRERRARENTDTEPTSEKPVADEQMQKKEPLQEQKQEKEQEHEPYTPDLFNDLYDRW